MSYQTAIMTVASIATYFALAYAQEANSSSSSMMDTNYSSSSADLSSSSGWSSSSESSWNSSSADSWNFSSTGSSSGVNATSTLQGVNGFNTSADIFGSLAMILNIVRGIYFCNRKRNASDPERQRLTQPAVDQTEAEAEVQVGKPTSKPWNKMDAVAIASGTFLLAAAVLTLVDPSQTLLINTAQESARAAAVFIGLSSVLDLYDAIGKKANLCHKLIAATTAGLGFGFAAYAKAAGADNATDDCQTYFNFCPGSSMAS